MEIAPRYEASDQLSVYGDFADQLVPATRQRRRLLALLGGLSDEQWATQSRCDRWRVKDVAAHLISVDGFWAASVQQACAGSPTRFLEGFDPAETPDALITASRDLPTSAVLEQLTAATETFLSVIASLDESQWSTPAETPVGHVPIRYLVQHALWDAWVHERDIALPLGLPVDIEPDEVRSALIYASSISPLFGLGTDEPPQGRFEVAATDPDICFHLEVGKGVAVLEGPAPAGTPRLAGDAAGLVDALTMRVPLPADTPSEWAELLVGLASVFDTEVVTAV